MSTRPDPEQSPPQGVTSLDPYTEFLHLAPEPRPPHLYQLLELELFCPHPEQIEHAVRKQFRKIKPFEEHPQREVRERIQDVLTHIATARTVLTDPRQRLRYDEMLAQHLGIDREEILRSRTAARLPEFGLLVIAGPSRVGSRLDLLPDRVITIGADPHCGLCLPGSRMCQVHGQLEYLDNQWLLRAAGSDALTLVNDQRCVEFLLADRDFIDIGGYRISFVRLATDGAKRANTPPPLSLIVREGPSIPEPVLNALPPTSILIGHCDTALWQLAGRLVSRHHARIESVGSLWELSDLQSTNGTLLNGERVARSPLAHRDQVRIGDFMIQVSLRR